MELLGSVISLIMLSTMTYDVFIDVRCDIGESLFADNGLTEGGDNLEDLGFLWKKRT